MIFSLLSITSQITRFFTQSNTIMIDVQETKQVSTGTSVFEQVEKMGHEQVMFCNDPQTGLKAIIAVHNTTLGPAIGGTRMWSYASEADAVKDALRLSRGMSFKNAIAGINAGGGKAVLIGNARTDKSEALLRRYGKFVDNLGGKYITAEDVGMSTVDMEQIAQETKHVVGMPRSLGGTGDPSPFTALGTYVSMKAAAKKAYGSDSLAGKKVSLQGVGHVGEYLIGHLVKEGCKVYVSDIYEDRLQEMVKKFGVEVVGLDEIYDLDVDIYAPCALGATVNDETLERLKCQIIAGSANNQLADEKKHGEACLKKGLVYTPDFLANAGGVVNVYSEVKNLPTEWVNEKVERIYDMMLNVLTISAAENKNAQEVAMEQAMKRINAMGHLRTMI